MPAQLSASGTSAAAGAPSPTGATVLGCRVMLITRSHDWPRGSICRGEFLTIALIGM